MWVCSPLCVCMSEFFACSYRLLRSLGLEQDKEPSVPHTVPSLPPPNQPWAQETKPFDGEEQDALHARLIGRVGSEIGIEVIDNEGLTAIWPTQMPFSLARREFRSEFPSKDSVYKRGKEEIWTHYLWVLFSQHPCLVTVWNICLWCAYEHSRFHAGTGLTQWLNVQQKKHFMEAAQTLNESNFISSTTLIVCQISKMLHTHTHTHTHTYLYCYTCEDNFVSVLF